MATTVKLPVWRTVGRAYGVAFHGFDDFLRLAWPWVLGAYAVAFGMQFQAAYSRNPAWLLVIVLVWMLVAAVLAVAWHQLVLLGEAPRHPAPLGGRQFRYLGAVVVLALAVGVPATAAVIGSVALIASPSMSNLARTFVAWLVIAGVGALVANRLALALPAVAVGDEETGFGRSWQLTRGNSWRLLWGGALTYAPFSIAAGSLQRLVAQADSVFTAIVLDLLAAAVTFFQVVVAAGFLSLAYDHFVGRPGTAELWERRRRAFRPAGAQF